MKEKVSFETKNSVKIDFGKNKFIEISRRVAIGSENSNEFIQISRGFYLPDGSKRYKKGSLAIPDSEEVKEFISEKIKEI